MTAISRNKVKIWIVAVDTAASALSLTDIPDNDGPISGQIKSYAKTGGEVETESDPVFGGYVDKEKPQTQFEVAFEIVPSLEDAHRFESMVYTVSDGVLVSGGSPADKTVFIEAIDGTSNPAAWGFNNCNVTVLDMEHNADDNQTKNMTLKFSPTNSSGQPNFIFNSESRDTAFTRVTDLPTWANLTAV